MTEDGAPTGRLAGFLAGLAQETLPEPVRAAARQQTLEILTGLFAGREVAEMIALLDRLGRAPPVEAEIPGTALGADRAMAGGLAAALAHAAEGDPIHAGTAICAAAVTVPAALVLAQGGTVSGGRFIDAVAGGCEAAVRTGRAIRAATLLARGWWPTAVCGGVGAAATASIALGLDARQTANALGLAAVQAGGLGGGGPAAPAARNLLCAQTVRNGIDAALLAQGGIEGPPEPLAGPRGLLTTFSELPDSGALTHALGARWAIAEVSLKKWPCALQAQTALDALSTLQRNGALDAGSVTAVEIALPGVMARIVDRPGPPASHFAACASIQFLAACLLIYGDVTAARLAAGRNDPEVLALAERVHLREDAALDSRLPDEWPARVAVTDGNGTHKADSAIPPGHPDRPLGFADSAVRFRRAGAPHLAAGRVEQVIEAVADLTDTPDAGALCRLLQPT